MSEFDSMQDWLAEELVENLNAVKVLPKRLFEIAKRIAEFENFYNLFEGDPASAGDELSRGEIQLSILKQDGEMLLQDTVPEEAIRQFAVEDLINFEALTFENKTIGLAWYFQTKYEELFFSISMTPRTLIFLEEKFAEIDANLSEDDA